MLHLPPIPLDHMTAEPILRLLIALRGHDAERFSVLGAWEAFKIFAAIETGLKDEGATFQAHPAEASNDQFELFFGRQFVGPDRSGHVLTSLVGVHVLMEHDGRVVESEELWSSDFPDMGSFFAKVESLRQLEIAADAPLVMVSFLSEEDVP